jgi:hypothetical protein
LAHALTGDVFKNSIVSNHGTNSIIIIIIIVVVADCQ